MKLRYLLPIVAPLLLTACEETIDPNHRYTPTSAIEIKRSVLVEEYTGTKCINAPRGHEVLESLSDYYNTQANFEQGNELIIVSLHIPGQGPTVEQGGLVTPEAADLTPEGVIPPQARINRSGRVLDLAEWSKVIAEQISREPGVTFPDRMKATFDGSTVKVDGVVFAGNNIGNARLHAWLIEDNVTCSQAMPDGTTDDQYSHRNVYRAYMTESCAGDDFALTRNVARRFSFSYPVSDSWNVADMRVAVFVETPTEGVLNACQSKIINL